MEQDFLKESHSFINDNFNHHHVHQWLISLLIQTALGPSSTPSSVPQYLWHAPNYIMLLEHNSARSTEVLGRYCKTMETTEKKQRHM